MVEIEELCSLIKQVLSYYGKPSPRYQALRTESVFDDVQRRYLLMSIGRDHHGQRVHHCFVHVNVINGNAVILANNMLPSIKDGLLAAGVPAEQITFEASNVSEEPTVSKATVG